MRIVRGPQVFLVAVTELVDDGINEYLLKI